MQSPWRAVANVACGLALAACGSEPLASDGTASGGSSGSGGSSATGGKSAVDRVPKAVSLVSLYEPPSGWSATALAFDPLRSDELWVTLRHFPGDAPCTQSVQTGCSALIGQVALVQAATSAAPLMTLKRDGNAWHFMRRPTSIAFGDNGNLATCGEARTDNYEDEAADYSGPALWSSDPAIFGAKPKAGQNGTHLDMLHETPFCMGIAHERDNVYFAFNGKLGALDRYDFRAPHVIGGEDHSDGELNRYVEGELLRVAEVPSHLSIDRARRELYVADTGHARVARLTIDSGTPGATLPVLEPMLVHQRIDGARFESVVPPGVVSSPSGIAFHDDVLLVTDNATGVIWWFERDGTALGQVETGLPAGALAGVTIGPDGKIYVSDMMSGRAYRLEER